MSGAESITEGALECDVCGRDVVEGWYDRCTGLGLLMAIGELGVLGFWSTPLRGKRKAT